MMILTPGWEVYTTQYTNSDKPIIFCMVCSVVHIYTLNIAAVEQATPNPWTIDINGTVTTVYTPGHSYNSKLT